MATARLLPVYSTVLDTDEVTIWCLLELFNPNLRIVAFNSCCVRSFKWEPKADLVQFRCKVSKKKRKRGKFRCARTSHQVTDVFEQRDVSWDVSLETPRQGGSERNEAP